MKRFAWILTLGAFCLGCNLMDNGGHCLIDNGARTLVVEPFQYCGHEDEHKTHVHDEKLARCAWEEFCKANPGQQFSNDFASGFTEGYADFLDAGGTTAPPALPPRTYWADRDCRQAAVDWLDGFHAGAQLARSTGLRQVVVVPTVSAVNCGAVPVYRACCNGPMTPAVTPIETVPAPAPPSPRQEPPSVPSSAPSVLPAAPMPAQGTTDAPAPYPPQLPSPVPDVVRASTNVPITGVTTDFHVEICPSGACFLNDSNPAFPEDINPFLSNEITGCSHETR